MLILHQRVHQGTCCRVFGCHDHHYLRSRRRLPGRALVGHQGGVLAQGCKSSHFINCVRPSSISADRITSLLTSAGRSVPLSVFGSLAASLAGTSTLRSRSRLRHSATSPGARSPPTFLLSSWAASAAQALSTQTTSTRSTSSREDGTYVPSLAPPAFSPHTQYVSPRALDSLAHLLISGACTDGLHDVGVMLLQRGPYSVQIPIVPPLTVLYSSWQALSSLSSCVLLATRGTAPRLRALHPSSCSS